MTDTITLTPDEYDRLLAARAVALEEATTYLQQAADDWRSTGNELPARKIEDEISGVRALATTDSTAALDRVIRAAELRGKRAAMDETHAALLAISQRIEAGG